MRMIVTPSKYMYLPTRGRDLLGQHQQIDTSGSGRCQLWDASRRYSQQLLMHTTKLVLFVQAAQLVYRGIHADVIVYIFAHLHTTLRTEGNMLDTN